MSDHLTLIVVNSSDSTSEVLKVIENWNDAHLFGVLGWMSASDLKSSGSFAVNVSVAASRDGSTTTRDFYELLTSRIWAAVTVVGLRNKRISEIPNEYFEGEGLLLELVRNAFQSNRNIVIRGLTVGIAENLGGKHVFAPHWDLHFLHEPKLYVDSQIASQPLTEEHRATSVLLLGVLASGGFRWQYETLIGELKDEKSMIPIVRIARANVRVVNAGRLTDNILAGAFPESGPWSQPSDVRNGVAMPLGAHVPPTLIESLVKVAGFVFSPWVRPSKKNAIQVGILQGLLLYLKHFVKFLTQVPSMIIEDSKTTIGDKVASAAQSITFGEDSTLQLAYRPNNNLSSDEILGIIRKSGMPELGAPIADSKPWFVLRQTALGLVDGGKIPEGVAEPLRGSRRLLYLDPNCIGPPISDRPFVLSARIVEGLSLPKELLKLNSLDVENFRLIKARVEQQLVTLRETKVEATDKTKAKARKIDPETPTIMLNLDEIEVFVVALDEWIDSRKDSLLWLVALSILQGIDAARDEMADAFKRVPPPNIAMEEEKKAHARVRKWTIRGLLALGVVVLTSILGVVFAIFSIFVWIAAVVSYLIGFVIRCASLARDLATLQFGRKEELREIELQWWRGQHSAKELVRLISVKDQLNEWQEIIREVVHAPFGRSNSFESAISGIGTIMSPPQFVLSSADPSEDQMTAAMSSARDQTVHAGWLNETFEAIKKNWNDQYKKWTVASVGDDLSPEMDNVDCLAVRGKRPLTRELLYYPRSDFHRAVLSGDLRSGLIQGKVEQIAANLRRTPLNELLSHVSVIGLGRALNGQTVDMFLDRLQLSKEEVPLFDPELFSGAALALRIENIDMSLPPIDRNQSHTLSESVRPGEELVAVAMRIDLSIPLPLDSLAVFDQGGLVARGKPVESERRGPSAV